MAGTKQEMILNVFWMILIRDKVRKVKADTTSDVEMSYLHNSHVLNLAKMLQRCSELIIQRNFKEEADDHKIEFRRPFNS